MNRKALIELATQEVGTIEKPVNKVKYNEWYGNGLENGGSHAPWCASFVSYVCHFSGNSLPKINHDEGFSYVPTLYAMAKKNGWITDFPQEGDIILFDWNGDNKHEHTGFFVSWKTTTHCNTIEGNTASDEKGNQSNGGGVFRKVRNKKLCTFVSLEKILQNV